jgi:hypothetical protein
MQKLFPEPSNSNLTQNYIGDVPSQRITTIPSIKIDESLTPRHKFAFYYSTTGTASAVSTPLGNADGLPLEIGQYRGTYIDTKTIRLNYDQTITPTLLLYIGAGWQRVDFRDNAPFEGFNPSAFGLSGFEINRQFPSVTGMCAGALPTPPGDRRQRLPARVPAVCSTSGHPIRPRLRPFTRNLHLTPTPPGFAAITRLRREQNPLKWEP